MAYEILWRLHAVLMSTAYASLVGGILISLFFKKKKWRFKTHKNLGIYAGISGVSALIVAAIMVQIYSGAHLTSLHAVLGAGTGALLILTPVAGLRIRKVKNKKRMKVVHKTMGYISLAMMTITLISGLAFTGIVSLTTEDVKPEIRSETGTNSEPVVVEIANEIEAGGVIFSWKIENGFMEGTLKTPAEGWIAIGFNPRA